MGFLHTKHRIHLHHKKVLAMSQLRSDILKKRKWEEINETEQQYKRIHIAGPVQLYEEEAEKEAEEENETQINISDSKEEVDTQTEDNNANKILNANHWLQIVENYVKMLDMENHLDNGENIIKEPVEFELGSHDIHPSDNLLAKWNLLNLFNDLLEAPVYISSLTNFDGN